MHAGFTDAYDQLVASVPEQNFALPPSKRVTLSASNISVPDFLRYVTQQTGESVACDESLDSHKIDIQVIDQPIAEVLQAVARRCGVNVTRVGSIYFLGQVHPEDRGVLCRRVSRLSGPMLREAVGVLLSENGRAVAHDDGLLIVGDRVNVLQRVAELLERIESAGADSWVIQLVMADRYHHRDADIGGGVNPTADVAYNFAAASSNNFTGSFNGGVNIEAAFRAVLNRSNKKAVFSPLIVVAEGAKAGYRSGQQLPVARKTVSPYGVVQTEGFDYLQTGTNISVSVRQMAEGLASLNLSLAMDNFDGFDPNSGGPVITKRQFETLANIRSGGVYLLGSFDGVSVQHTRPGLIAIHRQSDKTATSVDVWARCYKVGGARVTPSTDQFEPGKPIPILTTQPVTQAEAGSSAAAERKRGTEAAELPASAWAVKASWFNYKIKDSR